MLVEYRYAVVENENNDTHCSEMRNNMGLSLSLKRRVCFYCVRIRRWNMHGTQVQGRRGPALGQRSASSPLAEIAILPISSPRNRRFQLALRCPHPPLQAMLEQSPAATSIARIHSGVSFSMTCVTVRSTTPLASLAIMHRRRRPGSKPEMAAGTLLYHADIAMIV